MEYFHGGDIYTNRVELDYSTNLNPLGPPRGVVEAYLKAASRISAYPDSRCGRLRMGLSRFHGLEANGIICGNGAAELIFLIVQAVKPKRAMVMSPSFLEYRQALLAAGCQVQEFLLEEREGFSFSVSSLLLDLKGRVEKEEAPDLLFLCNPNNPTGLGVEADDLLSLVEYCEEQAILCVIDECFNEFMAVPERFSLMKELCSGRFLHLFILKAFTKVYAMAGLRLGYGLCLSGELFEAMESFRQPWSVSVPAQAAGEAAILEVDYVKKARGLVGGERDRLRDGLREMGFYVYGSMANYLFFRDDSREEGFLYRQCLKRGLLIRSCGNYAGLDGRYYRICVGNRENNGRFLKMLETACRQKG